VALARRINTQTRENLPTPRKFECLRIANYVAYPRAAPPSRLRAAKRSSSLTVGANLVVCAASYLGVQLPKMAKDEVPLVMPPASAPFSSDTVAFQVSWSWVP
jgi:hypothetical protein